MCIYIQILFASRGTWWPYILYTGLQAPSGTKKQPIYIYMYIYIYTQSPPRWSNKNINLAPQGKVNPSNAFCEYMSACVHGFVAANCFKHIGSNSLPKDLERVL